MSINVSQIFVRYPDGTSELIPGAVRVDTQNFHEGMFDFYDERGNLLKQISMNSEIKWETVGARNAGILPACEQ